MAKTNNLSAPHFHDADKARQYLESQVWPNGPVCPHCGIESQQHYELNGKTTRPGLYKCYMCREPFTVTVGTLFERSKIPLNKWLMAVYLLCSSKKGMSSHQLHRTLGITYKSAWFMTHRIREAMKSPGGLLGSGGGTVEADETFWLNSKRSKKGRAYKGRGFEHKEKIFALVERNGNVRTFHVPAVNADTLRPILKQQMAKDAHLMTDEAKQYLLIGKEFASHGVVKHGVGEYVRGKAHTNTVEGYFGLLKRGLIGTYHHCSAKHLQRYVSEFDFRYNNRKTTDIERSDEALNGITGKRLTYRPIDA